MFGAATRSAASTDQGIASGVASTAQQVGGAMGLALLVAVANADLPASPDAVTDGLRSAICIAVVAGIALTALVASRLRRPH